MAPQNEYVREKCAAAGGAPLVGSTDIGRDQPQLLYADDMNIIMLTKAGGKTAAAVLSIAHHEAGHELGVRKVHDGYTSKTAVLATGLAREEFESTDAEVQNGTAYAFTSEELLEEIHTHQPDTTATGPSSLIPLVSRYDYLGFHLSTRRVPVKLEDGSIRQL